MLHVKNIIYMAVFTMISFNAIAACRNVERSSNNYPMPGVTQDAFINIPIANISPMPSSMNDFQSRRMLTVKHSISGSVTCDGNMVLAQKLEYPMPNSGVMYQNSIPIYNTNLEGVGVSFHNDYGDSVAYTNEGAIKKRADYSDAEFNNSLNIVLNLWPLSGDTSHGIFDGASLPRAIVYATDSASGVLDSNAAIIARFSFVGQVIYNAPTCAIEDKEVFLGKYPLSAFSGSTPTGWVDASITMNCDRAFSSSSNSATSSTANGGSSSTSIGTVNHYRTSIEAVNGFIDSGRGIMAIDSGGATGVAVQISRYQREDSFTSLEWDTSYNPAESTNTFVMPLYARYIKTGSSVTAGKANSKLLYTVEYK
ncbi:fimbrial protein [Enterobacter quasiroggenkampii]|uniref:fimbrial protein n=1 Tax=Enterobacter quasiroggenkampii TaxID=2497436 RepID=UPI0021D2EE6F|nr:fimbrial protein [Enterobacter quasiroggenkampii]MCU6327472.1 fimbrial protein [Enterobacter quasiroggenkampii]